VSYVAIRLRGTVNVNGRIRMTLDSLNLKHVNNLVVVPEDEHTLGMLKKAKDYITWGNLDEATAELLLRHKVMVEGDHPLKEDFLKESGIDGFPEAAQKLSASEGSLKELGVKRVVRMAPAKGGLRTIKRSFVSHGDLGFRGDDINGLIKRMMWGELDVTE